MKRIIIKTREFLYKHFPVIVPFYLFGALLVSAAHESGYTATAGILVSIYIITMIFAALLVIYET